MLREDLECLTGKLIKGSLTPIIYDLLKDSPYIEDLRTVKGGTDVSKQRTNTNNKPIVAGGSDIDKWLRQHGKAVTL
jgi:hypothetical protein